MGAVNVGSRTLAASLVLEPHGIELPVCQRALCSLTRRLGVAAVVHMPLLYHIRVLVWYGKSTSLLRNHYNNKVLATKSITVRIHRVSAPPHFVFATECLIYLLLAFQNHKIHTDMRKTTLFVIVDNATTTQNQVADSSLGITNFNQDIIYLYPRAKSKR